MSEPDTDLHVRRAIEQRLQRVQQRIDAAARINGREPSEIRLLPVTKFHPIEAVLALQSLGVSAVGENRDQEARGKKDAVPTMSFHMIGQIQRKKTNSIARWADWVHSVDSIEVARGLVRGMDIAVERGQRAEDEVLDCLVQLSADGDSQRGGASKEAVSQIVEVLESGAHTRMSGVMIVPPLESDPRAVFDSARTVVDLWREQLGRGLDFSAGMSADLPEAIAAGSTIVRVGTDILGPRPVL